MRALIVTAHPDPASLTHSIAAQVAEGVSQSGTGHCAEIADLAAEGFDPRFTAADRVHYRAQSSTPDDVAAEQARIDRADALVLVYPVYWWSMPGVLKGWIDRVFANGWAYDYDPDGGLVKKLRHLRVHLVAIAGADARMYARHGYFGAMRTQIDHGIFDFCGSTVITSELMLDSETLDPAPHLDLARRIGSGVFTADTTSGRAAAA